MDAMVEEELPVLQCLGGKVALNDELVQPAVVDHDDPHSREDGVPRELLVAGVPFEQEHLEFPRIVGREFSPAAAGLERDEEDDHAADEQGDPLNEVGVGDGLESARCGIEIPMIGQVRERPPRKKSEPS